MISSTIGNDDDGDGRLLNPSLAPVVRQYRKKKLFLCNNINIFSLLFLGSAAQILSLTPCPEPHSNHRLAFVQQTFIIIPEGGRIGGIFSVVKNGDGLKMQRERETKEVYSMAV